MTSASDWPSRRVQVIVIILLIIGAALAVFVPPSSREKRADQLYMNAMFDDDACIFREYGFPHKDAATSLEEALRLSPNNSLYEQALVWKYPKDKLPELLKNRKLCPKATILANSRLHAPAEMTSFDPGNGYPHYMKAGLLEKQNRFDEMYSEIRICNRCKFFRLYYPEVSESVLDSSEYYALAAPIGAEMPFNVERKIERISKEYLRAGRVEEASSWLEEMSLLGVRKSCSEPYSIIDFCRGYATFSMAVRDLRPIYKDFGKMERLKALDRPAEKYGNGHKAIDRFLKGSQRRANLACARIQTLDQIVEMPILGLRLAFWTCVFCLFSWIVNLIIARRRKENAPSRSPWSEGWLTKLFISVQIPATAAAVFLFYLNNLYGMEDSNWAQYLRWESVLVVAQVLVLGLVIRRLRRTYTTETGERTGLMRFLFKSPASVRAWNSKCVAGALGAQIVFIGCTVLLAMILCKTFLGVQFWQLNRLPLHLGQAEEIALVQKIDSRIIASCPANWQFGEKAHESGVHR